MGCSIRNGNPVFQLLKIYFNIDLLFSVIDKEFWYSFNYFYCAVLFQYYHIWKTEHKSIKDSGYVLQSRP